MWPPPAALRPTVCRSGITRRRWWPSGVPWKRIPAAGCCWEPSSTNGPSSPTGLEAELRSEFDGAVFGLAHCLPVGLLCLVRSVLGELARVGGHEAAALRQHLVEFAIAADHRDGPAAAGEDPAHIGREGGEILQLVGVNLHQIFM